MAFTVKYRMFEVSGLQPADGPPLFRPVELLDGPFHHISQSWEDGRMVVHCHRDEVSPGMPYGPVIHAEADDRPRPTLWVMNEQGATVAKYDL